MKDRVRDVRERLTMEHVLLATFIGTSVYMFVESLTFQPAGGMFPRFTAGAVIVLGLLLVFREYLPASLQRIVIDEEAMFDVDEIVEDVDVDISEDEAEGERATAGEADVTDEEVEASEKSETESESVGIAGGSFVTGGFCVAYLFASYLIGMLWATPLFVAAYTRWTGQRWLAVIGLTALSFVLAFLFYDVLNLDIMTGWIHEWLVGVL
ncbi:tripartite tricarboxylate transporter TctB family protein [Halorubrum vacuolatum]|uniref:Tripartite tricarboxylate transporter TctB family protein n=1 Tax=Halorubrum vacuolatum TaxID=63740 RepID=A0A238X2W9_HALVU|nr:tripartite tricarboxylate transporter TctB family protein [Halorubrum vacuolatum]SNR53335.1 Tripartite tricarboxylate transporter TctB family protein [Halorubrum vacuolatum]